MALSLEQFVEKTLKLLEEERGAEIEETRILQENVSPKELERRGVGLSKLRIGSQHTGLYGRTILLFESYWPGKELPAHNFTPGDISGVSLSSGDGHQDMLASGIVSRVNQSSVSIAFDENIEALVLDDSAQYRLIKLANDVTYQRLKKCLSNLNSYRNGPSSQLISVLFGDSKISPPYSEARDGKVAQVKDLTLFNAGLDDSQQEAVRFALKQRELAIIHGPPGTGKTTTVVEIIQQAVLQGLKILACAPSNIAVDNLVERLAGQKTKIVRLGHPARLLPSIQKHALDAILSGSDETKLVHDVRKDMDQTMAKMRKCRDKGERQSLREDMKHLRKELRQREEAATRGILQRAEVVLATLTSATDDGPLKLLDEEHFDLIVVDECSQALEAACWIALLRGPRCILAGDHLQLPPTILSHRAAAGGLAVTLMERQLQLQGECAVRMLTTQYRMHQDIMSWPSQQLYQGKLQAHPSVAHHLLKDLPGVSDTEDTQTPLLLIDTAGCDLWELELTDEQSEGNEGEADIVAAHVENLIKCGLSPENIAVIAPYNLQVDLLRLRLSTRYSHLEIKSVDGFQGREKEAVVLSLVRSNQNREVGFLAEDRRINVAITRARRHLAVICDSETVGHHAFLKSLMEFMMDKGEVRSAFQYKTETEFCQILRPDHLTEQLSRKTNASHPRSKSKPKHSASTGASYMKQRNVPNNIQLNKETQKVIEDTRREELKKILTAFTANRNLQMHKFPSSLTSHERFLVHEISEALGLFHISKGDGEERYIVVSKTRTDIPETGVTSDKTERSITNQDLKLPNTNTADQNKPNSAKKKKTKENGKQSESITEISEGAVTASIDTTSDKDCSNKEEDNNTTICDKCNKELPLSNLELHSMRCQGLKTNLQPSQSKPKKQKKSRTSLISNTEEEDFDALIAAAVKENTQCHMKKCKASIQTLGQICPFCGLGFCLSHHMPEVHGCGDKARSHARMLISRDGVLHRGSGVPDKKPDQAKRAHLQRKLDKKLDDLASQRKHKGGGKKS